MEIALSVRQIRNRFICFLSACLLTVVAVAQTNHTVTSGDTLDSISKKYNVSASAIAAHNNLDNPNLIVPGSVLKIPPSRDAPKSYTVKSGDTLGSIAVAHGTTIAAISGVNQIPAPDNLKVGQVLIIPAGTKNPEAAVTDRYPLPAGLKRILDATPANKSKWKYIVVHHSATRNGTLQGMEMYHRQKRKMENGLAYHFVIGNGRGMPDGKIEIGNRWKRQIKGGHLASDQLNSMAIGICLVGNFEADPPSAAQMQSLQALVSYLRKRCNIPKSGVRTHTQINTKPTACPGKRFPTTSFLNNL